MLGVLMLVCSWVLSVCVGVGMGLSVVSLWFYRLL